MVQALLAKNDLADIVYSEAFAGGASIALTLLFEDQAAKIRINDLSPQVHAFWWSVLNEPRMLARRIKDSRVTMTAWHRHRKCFLASDTSDPISLGFATLFMNRTNRSGILTGGVIGGKDQGGPWALDARWNADELVRRVRAIGDEASRIELSQLDAAVFVRRVQRSKSRRSLLFVDPPYIGKGQDLYLDEYELSDHLALATVIERTGTPWIVTYDEAAIDASLFPRSRRVVYDLHYTAQGRYRGREVAFVSDDLELGPITELLGPNMHLHGRGSRLRRMSKLIA